jgi:2-succinyl-6-hydroxy-2,4-cyclohexadiene-1-carboxylate synthase
MKLYALHGFLGTPQDWDFLKGRVEAIDLTVFPTDSLEVWAQHFNAYVHQQAVEEPRVLLGYSLGGRLALHCLLQDPALWRAGIIVSAHCGLDSEEKKSARRLQDEKWAHCMETLEWGLLMERWNAQKVFCGFPPPFQRREELFSRKWLAQALRGFSLGGQQDLRVPLAHLQLPLLWVTGGKDAAFFEIAKTVQLKDPLSKMHAIAGAGHRVPWEQTGAFVELVSQFCLALNV